MAQKSAVQWLFKQLTSTWYDVKSSQDLLDKAKAIEIEHLEDCWIAAEQSKDSQTFFNYYNETYNK